MPEESAISKRIAEIDEEMQSLQTEIKASYDIIGRFRGQMSLGQQLPADSKEQLGNSAFSSSSRRRAMQNFSVNVPIDERLRAMEGRIELEQEKLKEKLKQKEKLGYERWELMAELKRPLS